MIYEYALEPELVAAWASDKQKYKSILKEFGLGSQRSFSRFPKGWIEKAVEAIDSKLASNRELDKKRLLELFKRFKENMVKRKEYRWSQHDRGCWLQNALSEHDRFPFQGIISSENPQRRPEVITEKDIFEDEHPLWDIAEGSILVKRNEIGVHNAIITILANSSEIRFVDPYISPSQRGFKSSLAAFFVKLSRERSVGRPKSIQVHLKKHDKSPSWSYLCDELAKLVPAGLQVTLHQWREKPEGQKFHNRYILTNLGGIAFGHGLDEGGSGETDDISRLSSETYQEYWHQYYCENATTFLQEEKDTIIGRASL